MAVLAEGVREAGFYAVVIQAAELRSGMYFAHLKRGSRAFARRVVIVRQLAATPGQGFGAAQGVVPLRSWLT